MVIDQKLIDALFEKAKENPHLRTNLDLRTSDKDGSQRMLNALMPGTVVPIHRHPQSNENVVVLKGRMVEIIYQEVTACVEGQDEDQKVTLKEIERVSLCPEEGIYGYQVPQGVWHTIEVIEPTLIYEGKDGRYGFDGTERWEDGRWKM